MSCDVLVLRGEEIRELFQGRETGIIEAVKQAYVLDTQGQSSVPNCPFLRFPVESANRIIAKPAYLGGRFSVAGVKWVSSFPCNLDLGLNRASAVIVLNSASTGYPEAIMEGSVISACRTAASAALAEFTLRKGARLYSAGFIGCGPVNFEILRFLAVTHPELSEISCFDIDPRQAARFGRNCSSAHPGRRIKFAATADEVLHSCEVTSLATNAGAPHISCLETREQRPVVLHISLRDFTPDIILSAENIVDNVEHVCTNRTSLDLAAQQSGTRDFIRGTLGSVLLGACDSESERPLIFSPFGLGILDIAVAKLAVELALAGDRGRVIRRFAPDTWTH